MNTKVLEEGEPAQTGYVWQLKDQELYVVDGECSGDRLKLHGAAERNVGQTVRRLSHKIKCFS